MIQCSAPYHGYQISLHFEQTGLHSVHFELTRLHFESENRPRITDWGNRTWSTLQRK